MSHDHQYPTHQQSQPRPRGQRPADVIRDGALKATIWENASEKGPYHTTTLAKTFEDKSGKLRDTHSFSNNDLLRVSELARQAYTRSNELRRDLNQSRSNGHDAQNPENRGNGAQTHDSRDARREAYQDRRGGRGNQHPEPIR